MFITRDETPAIELGSSGGVLGRVAPAGVPLAVSPAGAGLRRITLYQLSMLCISSLRKKTLSSIY
jgi:hypothetical protein